MQLVTFGIDKDKKSYSAICRIHTTIHTTATDIIPDRNSTSSNHRPEYVGTILHTLTG